MPTETAPEFHSLFRRATRVLVLLALSLLGGVSAEAGSLADVGKAWRLTAPMGLAADLNCVVWTGSKLVAGGNGVVATSADGISWTTTPMKAEQKCMALAVDASGGKLVMITSDYPTSYQGNSRVMTSTDGVTWVVPVVNYTGSFKQVCWLNGQFVGLGALPPVLGPNDYGPATWHFLTSPDGVTWQAREIALPTTSRLVTCNFVAWTGTRYVVAGSDSYYGKGMFVTSSLDGITWETPEPLTTSTTSTPSALVWTGSQMVVTEWDTKVYVSATGQGGWVAHDAGANVASLVWDGTRLVGAAAGVAVSSADGASWTHTAVPSLPYGRLCVAGGQYVLAGAQGHVHTSVDGTSWVQRSPQGVAITANGVLWTGTQYVAVGGSTGAQVATSPDGVTWTVRTTPAGMGVLYSVAKMGTKLLAAGKGVIFSADDGVTWKTSGYVGYSEIPFAVAASDSIAVVVGGTTPYYSDHSSSPFAAWSSDLTTWHYTTLPSGVSALHAVTYANAEFFAAGDNRTRAWSSDGKTWQVVGGSTPHDTGPSSTTYNSISNHFASKSRGLTWTGTNYLSVDTDAGLTPYDDGYGWRYYKHRSPQQLNAVTFDSTRSQALAAGNGVVMVSDTVPDLNFDVAEKSVWEMDGTTTVTVSLAFAAVDAVTVPVTLGGTATPGADKDYTIDTTTLTFAPGEISKQLTLTLNQDLIEEPAESIQLTLGAPTGGPARLGAVAVTTVTLLDADTAPPVSFDLGTPLIATEADGQVTAWISLGWATTTPVRVPLVASGTALPGVDFTLPPDLVFNPGEKRKQVTVPILQDTVMEPDKTLTLALGAMVHGVPGKYPALNVTLRDDDVADGVGEIWVPRTTPFDTKGAGFNAVTWSGAQFLAVGDGGLMAASPDGAAWTLIPAKTKYSLRDVAWSGTQFVVVGDHGTVLTSANGTAWTVRALPTTVSLSSIAWSGSLFVAAGTDGATASVTGKGVLYSSPDGSSWTRRMLAPDYPFLQVVCGEGGFVALGYDGLVIQSVDGLHWPPVPVYSSYGPGVTAMCWTGSTYYGAAWTGHVLSLALDYIYYWNSDVSVLPAGYQRQQSPTCLRWTGNTFIQVGGGAVLASRDGVYWYKQDSAVGPSLRALAWNGAVLIGVGVKGVIATSGSGAPPLPKVNFSATSLVAYENQGIFTLSVDLSSAPLQKVTVPFALTGDLLTDGRLVLPPGPLVFNVGETHKSLLVKVINDNAVKPAGTGKLSLSISGGGAALGPAAAVDIRVEEDDVGVTFTKQPPSAWLALGDTMPTALEAQFGDDGSSAMTCQWKKDGKAVPWANVLQDADSLPRSTFNLGTPVKFADAGAYTLVVTNAVGTFSSSAAQIAVVDYAPHTVIVGQGDMARLSVNAQGNGLHYQWYRGTDPIPESPPRITGTHSATLIITGADATLDATQNADNSYYCRLTGDAQADSTDTGLYQLAVTVNAPSLVLDDPLPTGSVAMTYLYDKVTTVDPVTGGGTFTATGLPLGLTMDPATGVISGVTRLTVTNKLVTITATNAKGKDVATTHLTIDPLEPRLLGAFQGYLPRQVGDVGPDMLPGHSQPAYRFEATITSTGSCTGKLITGATSVPFAGSFTGWLNPDLMEPDNQQYLLSVRLLMRGQRPQTLWMGSLLGDNLLSVALQADDAPTPAQGQAWRNVYSSVKKAAKVKGYNTFSLKLTDADTSQTAVPYGSGRGACTVPDTGASFVVSGTLPDGSNFACASFLGPQGQVLLYQPLYANQGEIAGGFYVSRGTTTANLDGTLSTPGASASQGGDNISPTWYKPAAAASSKDRVYRDGFNGVLEITGGRYVAPSPGHLVLDAASDTNSANATLSFDSPALSGTLASPGLEVELIAGGGIRKPAASDNPCATTLVVAPSTGFFSGTFTVKDADPVKESAFISRTTSYRGVITPDNLLGTATGNGFFQLPTIVDPTMSSVPASQAPILSGAVGLTKF